VLSSVTLLTTQHKSPLRAQRQLAADRAERAGSGDDYDKDILIYCISQLMEKLKRREPVAPRIRIKSHDLLVFIGRSPIEYPPSSRKRLDV
jgi:hypothetical protein